MPGLQRQPAQEIRCRATSEKQNGKPKRDHADDGKISEKQVLDDAIAQDVDLGADGSSHFFAAGEVAVKGIQGDRRHRQGHGQQVQPRAMPKQADSGEAHDYAQKRDFVWRPDHGTFRVGCWR
jgi:hypothetical protein